MEAVTEQQRGSRAAFAGFLFSALFLVAWVLRRNTPTIDAPDDELLAYFLDDGHRRAWLVSGLYVIPFAGIAFIWFAAALRDRLVTAAGREHGVLSAAQLMAATLFVGAVFTLAATELATGWAAKNVENGTVDIASMRVIIALGTAIAQIVVLRAGAVFVAISSSRAMRAKLFPRWFCIVGYVVAVAMLLVASRWRVVLLMFPLWVVGASVMVLVGRRNLSEPTHA